ncbi:YesL family protein [Bilifractor porci]|jgi:uncharacterized membrane protein YesL|uniref:DUF624 domain-containing protein n=1 Tax=Bilifractor porci TaxID=2606636 RepID=A0A7X2P6W8_9FIRM|nr:YesL family protein [Bilifractor porci]MST81319.1 DUF624 domain-containing protein [Bilifractor porci]
MKFFNMDSPVSRFLTKLFDIVWLNILTMICALPIVTAGASFTAMHYVLLHMVRNEEGYIAKSFFRAFKQNFRQATLVWLTVLPFLLLYAGIFVFFGRDENGSLTAAGIAVLVAFILLLPFLLFLFPLLARFETNIRQLYKNTVLIMFAHSKTSIFMILTHLVFWYAIWKWLAYVAFLIPLMFFTLPGYICAVLYTPVLKKYEPEEQKEENAGEEGEQ